MPIFDFRFSIFDCSDFARRRGRLENRKPKIENQLNL